MTTGRDKKENENRRSMRVVLGTEMDLPRAATEWKGGGWIKNLELWYHVTNKE
jgi:hypothetical protein